MAQYMAQYQYMGHEKMAEHCKLQGAVIHDNPFIPCKSSWGEYVYGNFVASEHAGIAVWNVSDYEGFEDYIKIWSHFAHVSVSKVKQVNCDPNSH